MMMLSSSSVAPRGLLLPSRCPRVEGRGGLVVGRAVAGPAGLQGEATTSPSSSPSRLGLFYTSYEGNSFGVVFHRTGVRVLVDPWLDGDLTFFEQDWLYRGKKRIINATERGRVDVAQLGAQTDVVVLTQYLPDHCHLPTLRKLPRTIPIVANPGAAELIRPLGFSSVRVLDHGETADVADGRLKITASAGALVGPPWSKRQNGVTFREVAADAASLYFEPHCDFTDSSVRSLGRVDVVVSPVKTTLLGNSSAAYPLVMGDINILRLLQILKPKVLVPLLNAEIDQEGPLSALILDRGSLEAVQQQLAASGLATRMQLPAPPGEALAVEL